MAGLSLMQMRSFIDRLGDLDDEVTRVCRASELIAKRAGKDHASGAERLKEAREALEEKQKSLRDAKDCLLGFDGFLHAESGAMRQAMVSPKMGGFFGRIGDRMMPPLEAHVGIIVDEVGDGLRRVRSSVRDLREAEQEGRGNIKDSVKTLGKICSAAEKAIGKAMKASAQASTPEHGYEHMHATEEPEEAEEEIVVEKTATDVGFHGYNLTAKEMPDFIKEKIEEREGKKDKEDDKDEKGKKAKELPPEFLENIEKKKEEAGKKDKKDDKDKKAHGYDLTAESLVPGNKSKGPKELGQEEMGWDPGHRTTQEPTDEDEEKKKASADHGYVLSDPPDHGYDLTA